MRLCQGFKAITLYSGELCEVVNNDFAGVYVIVNKGYPFTRPLPPKDGNASEAESSGTQNLLRSI